MKNFLLKIRHISVLRSERFLYRKFGNNIVSVPLAMLIGVVAAFAAAALHSLVSSLEKLSLWMESRDNFWFFALFLIMPFIGIFLSFMVQRWLGGQRYAKSLSPMILSLNRRQTRIPLSEVFTHMLSSAFSVGCGGSAGLEAPSVLTGAAIGSNTASFFGINRKQRTLLIGCGGAAAIAAIFQSPIGGVLFAVEVLLPEFSVAALVPLLISSAVAMVVSRAAFPTEQVLLAINEQWKTNAIPYYFLCGLLCAFVGVLVIRTAYGINKMLKKYFVSKYKKLLVGGLLLCVLLGIFPILRGQGYLFIKSLFDGKLEVISSSAPLLKGLPLPVVFVLLFAAAILLKTVTSVLTVEAGGDGGIFAPTMFIGAFTGFAFARLINLTGIIELQEANFVVVGICGVFTAVMSAPLTGIFLIADVTDGYIILVPLMIVSSVAWFVARFFEPHSIYHKALAEADLLTPDRDRMMLKSFSVRICINPGYTPLKADGKVVDMLENADADGGQEIFPVLDDEKHLLGVVHLEKLLPLMVNPELAKSLLVFDLMEKPCGEIADESDLDEAMKNLERFKLNYLPVRDRHGRFKGFAGRAEIFKLYRSLIRDI